MSGILCSIGCCGIPQACTTFVSNITSLICGNTIANLCGNTVANILPSVSTVFSGILGSCSTICGSLAGLCGGILGGGSSGGSTSGLPAIMGQATGK